MSFQMAPPRPAWIVGTGNYPVTIPKALVTQRPFSHPQRLGGLHEALGTIRSKVGGSREVREREKKWHRAVLLLRGRRTVAKHDLFLWYDAGRSSPSNCSPSSRILRLARRLITPCLRYHYSLYAHVCTFTLLYLPIQTHYCAC